MRYGKGWVCMALGAIVAVAVVGCGSSSRSSSSSSTSTTATIIPSVAAMVPASVKSKGTYTVAADASYPPDEFLASDGHTVEGMDADLAKAVGAAMGLKVDVVNATFDTIIPGLVTRKYDMGASSITDTKAREKQVDFVTYFSTAIAVYTAALSGVSVNTLTDLCGHTVAVEKGTTEQSFATAQAAKCQSSGKTLSRGVLTLLVFPNQNGVNLALRSGQAQIGMADLPVAAYAVKRSDGLFKLAGLTFGTALYGLALPKDNGMAKAVLAAVKALMADGTYNAIMTKWFLQPGGISNPMINGATH